MTGGGMIAEYYFWAWGLYLSACAGFFVLFWWVTRILPRFLRQPLRGLAAVILLVPVPTTPGQGYWVAPAIAVLFLETMSQGFDQGRRALLAIIVATLLVIFLSIVAAMVRRNRRLKKMARGGSLDSRTRNQLREAPSLSKNTGGDSPPPITPTK